MTQFMQLRSDGDISVLTLDDGKVNPFSFDMIASFQASLDRVPQDRGALVVTGRPGIFSAGFDLRVVRGGDNETLLTLVEKGLDLILRLAQFPRPVVFACSGHGVALGAFLLLVGDWRVGASGPFQISLNEVRNGLPLPSCFRTLARSRIAANWFDRVFLHAEAFAPEEAVAPGFLDEVVPPEVLMARALEQARRLATLPHPAYSVAKQRDRAPLAQAVMANFAEDARAAFAETLPSQPSKVAV